MRLYRVFTSLILALLISETALSLPRGDGQPETLEGALQRHHIALTKDALVNALRNPDAEARRLAAQKLAQDDARDTIPSIVSALKAETIPLNQVNIAFSLAQLGDDLGIATLKARCKTPTVAAGIRMLAAQYMLWLHSDECQNAVVQVLQSEGDSDSRIQALSLVPNLRHLSEDESREVFNLVVKALEDQAPGVRMSASSMLGRIGNVSAIPHLQRALAKEQDGACVLEMRMDLQRLQGQERSH